MFSQVVTTKFLCGTQASHPETIKVLMLVKKKLHLVLNPWQLCVNEFFVYGADHLRTATFVQTFLVLQNTAVFLFLS
jgi:hypothetical protein